MAVNPRNFLLNTDYTLDKVVGYDTGSVEVAASDSGTASFQHGLSYAPLYYMKWSTSSDFGVSYDMTGLISSSDYAMSAQSDTTNMYLFALNLTGSPVTLYYRLLYFMPSDINHIAEQTESDLDNFVLSTDYNYTKLLYEGVTSGVNETVVHGLGYYPQCEVWYERDSDGRIVYVTGNLPDGSWSPVASISTNQLVLEDSTGTVAKWHYKIYADEV